MQILIDGKEVSGAFVAEKTLRDALLHVQSHLCPEDHIVVAVRCDDQEIPREQMEETLDRPAASFRKVEITTSTPARLVADAMSQASSALDETEESCRKVAQMLTAGQTVEAARLFGECLRIWQQIHEAVSKSIRMLQLDPSTVTVRDESLMDVVAKPRDVLLQVRQALQAQDHVLLADLLQYEFADVTEQWHALIARLEQEARDRMTPEPDDAEPESAT